MSQKYPTQKPLRAPFALLFSSQANAATFPSFARGGRNSDYVDEIPMAAEIKLPASLYHLEEPARSSASPPLDLYCKEKDRQC